MSTYTHSLTVTHAYCTVTCSVTPRVKHPKGRRRRWLITERERQSDAAYLKVKLKTSLSDPGTPLITHSLKEKDRTEEEVRKRERKIKRGRARMREVKGPCRHLKSQQAQTYPSSKNQEHIRTFYQQSCSPMTRSAEQIFSGNEPRWIFSVWFSSQPCRDTHALRDGTWFLHKEWVYPQEWM